MTGAERIAAHVMAAGPGGGVRAAQALREAAGAAWARGAPETAAAYLRRAAEEQLPRAELVPLLRELARALIATEGPGGFPALREALALASDAEREEIVVELGRALMIQGYFSDAAAVFARGRGEEARTELATVSVLDLALVRAAGGLDALAARAPARRLRRRRVDRGRPPPAREHRRRPRRAGRSPTPADLDRGRADRADGRRAARARRRELDRRRRRPPARTASSSCCASPSRCGRSCASARAASPRPRPTCAS